MRPDLAILAAAGRGNVDGEPIQGSLDGFIAREADSCVPGKFVLCHHDNWNPPLTSPINVESIPKELRRHNPGIEVVEMDYSEECPILGRNR